MRIHILSREPRSYSTRRLKAAAKARGHDARVIDTLGLTLSVASRSGFTYRGKPLRVPAAVIPRVGASVTAFGTAVVRHYEQLGAFTTTASHALSISRDKLRALQALTRHHIAVPPTVFVRRRDAILGAVASLGGAPVVLKLLEGTQGVGVILAGTDEQAKAIVETLTSLNQAVLVQKFVAEAGGCDLRAIVVGGEVVAAMRRRAKPGEFRSNVHQGGTAERITLDPEVERLAVRSAHVLGLRVAGVDLLEAQDGPKVIEVNSSPGLEGIEAATGIDVAGAILDELDYQMQLRDVDIRQRLTLEKGYGVADVPVTPRSELCDRTLRELALEQRGVQVLSIQRGSVTLPHPAGDDRLVRGDVVTCYGKLLTLTEILPKKRRRTRAQKLPPDGPPPLADLGPGEESEAFGEPVDVEGAKPPSFPG